MKEYLTIGTFAIIALAITSLYSQRPTRIEMLRAPKELRSNFHWGTEAPSDEGGCAANEIYVYPSLRVVMPGSKIEAVVLEASICEGGHRHPLKIVQAQ